MQQLGCSPCSFSLSTLPSGIRIFHQNYGPWLLFFEQGISAGFSVLPPSIPLQQHLQEDRDCWKDQEAGCVQQGGFGITRLKHPHET